MLTTRAVWFGLHTRSTCSRLSAVVTKYAEFFLIFSAKRAGRALDSVSKHFRDDSKTTTNGEGLTNSARPRANIKCCVLLRMDIAWVEPADLHVLKRD